MLEIGNDPRIGVVEGSLRLFKLHRAFYDCWSLWHRPSQSVSVSPDTYIIIIFVRVSKILRGERTARPVHGRTSLRPLARRTPRVEFRRGSVVPLGR